jgi:hypothetical protein
MEKSFVRGTWQKSVPNALVLVCAKDLIQGLNRSAILQLT